MNMLQVLMIQMYAEISPSFSITYNLVQTPTPPLEVAPSSIAVLASSFQTRQFAYSSL